MFIAANAGIVSHQRTYHTLDIPRRLDVPYVMHAIELNDWSLGKGNE
jgi:hypothetical protein